MGAFSLLLTVTLFFHLSYSAVIPQILIQSLCELNIVTNANNQIISLNRTSACKCEGIAIPPWVLPTSDKLQIINLPNCQFSGTLLARLNASNQVLSYVDIEGNNFAEPIPPFIANLYSLQYFDISNNFFTGEVRFDRTGSTIQYFDVSHNELTGSAGNFFLPSGRYPDLRFFIGGNKFSMGAAERVPMPAELPDYLAPNGTKYSRPQISCITFIRGSFPPLWCNIMGPLCACKEVCGNDYLEREESCETTGADGDCCANDCKSFKNSSTTCQASQSCLTGKCNGVGTCLQTRAPNGTLCRPATEPCDIPEYCTGSDNSCPHDTFAPSSVICRPKAGACDIVDYCSGDNATCPHDNVFNNTVLCRAQNGTCDIPELCDGVGGECPNNTFHDNTFVCRAQNGSCDAIEFCTGSTGDCPANSFLTGSTLCRPSAGFCDIDDFCPGDIPDCPDIFASSNLTCRPAINSCDSPELCTGNSSNCPIDVLFNSTRQCRPSNGDCDTAEYCDGVSASCPVDIVLQNSTTCRVAISSCDLPEVCDGHNITCPPDLFQTDATIVCREANGSCDIRELCTGISPFCPNDTYARGDVCRAVNGTCDNAEICTGNSPWCPPDTFYNRTYVCRSPKSVCDIVEFCTGTSPECPTDIVANPSIVCRPANLSCDIAEKCDGISPECPTDIFQPTSLVCRTSNGICDVPENCTGDSPSCPDNSFKETSVICRNSIAPCDATEYCTGDSPTCPSDSKSNSSYVCRAPQAPCDAPEYCSGTSLDCPPDLMANSSTVCRTPAGSCDLPEYCNGTSTECPADKFELEGLVCRPNAGICDVDEYCDGTSPHCPMDKYRVSSGPADTCLPALGQCGPAQYCSGTKPTCPDRVFVECPGGMCDQRNGACFCKDNQTVYPECQEFCGDFKCNQGGTETCVNCPSDCKAPCNLCGDGICTSQLAENCDSCLSDCSRTCPLRRCSRVCTNGQCSNGRCQCYGSSFGPICSERALRVDASAIGSYPAVVAIVTFPNGDRKRFTLGLVQIVEETPFGGIVKSIDLSNTVFAASYNFDGFVQTWSFNRTLVGIGQIKVNFTYAAAPSLNKRDVKITANTFQMKLDLSSWAFTSASNNLQVITQNSIENLNLEACEVETSLYGSNVEWLMMHHEGIGLYYETAQMATLDGYPRYISNTALTDASIVTYLPFFWYNLSLYTTFGFISDSNFTGCDGLHHKGKGTKWEVYLSIPAVIIFLIILFLVIMCILRPTRCFRRRRNVPSFDSKHPMMDPKGSEMVILPPPPPPASQEPASPPPPPPPETWQDTRASHLPVDPRMYAAPPPGHMSMQYAPPPSASSQANFGRPMHASAPYSQFSQQESHHNLLPPPAPSAPMPSPDANQNYMPDE